MTPGSERHCRWLLHACPVWYRRDRAGEMLGTLLESSPHVPQLDPRFLGSPRTAARPGGQMRARSRQVGLCGAS